MDERQQADAFDDFLDRLATGETTSREMDLELARIARRFGALGQSPAPAGARERVLRRVASSKGRTAGDGKRPEHLMPILDVERSSVAPNGRAEGPIAYGASGQRPTPRIRWAGVQFATALLLVVTLGLGYLALRPGTPESLRLAALPALVAPATPASTEQARQTLATITMPAGTVPSEIFAALSHFTIPAGSQSGTGSTWVSTCCVGVRFEYIVSGSFTVHSAGPVQVLHGGASAWETIPAGTEISVTAGDALLLRMEDAFDVANSGSVPVELVEGNLFDGKVINDPNPHDWIYHNQEIHRTLFSVPSGPATVRLQLTTLARGADLPLPPGAIAQFAVSLEQGATLGTREDFAKRNISPRPVVAYVLTLAPADREIGTGTPAPG
jgi:hypothetical protein